MVSLPEATRIVRRYRLDVTDFAQGGASGSGGRIQLLVPWSMQHLELNHTFNSPHDQDGGPGDRWMVALVTAEQRDTLTPGQPVLCTSGPVTPFVGMVVSIGETPNGEGRYFAVVDPEK